MPTNNVAWTAVVLLIWDSDALKYHVAAMALGQCFTAFFAVWTTHHDCDKDGLFARSIRNHIKATLTYNMFYHFEHHVFPTVPVQAAGTGAAVDAAVRTGRCN